MCCLNKWREKRNHRRFNSFQSLAKYGLLLLSTVLVCYSAIKEQQIEYQSSYDSCRRFPPRHKCSLDKVGSFIMEGYRGKARSVHRQKVTMNIWTTQLLLTSLTNTWVVQISIVMFPVGRTPSHHYVPVASHLLPMLKP